MAGCGCSDQTYEQGSGVSACRGFSMQLPSHSAGFVAICSKHTCVRWRFCATGAPSCQPAPCSSADLDLPRTAVAPIHLMAFSQAKAACSAARLYAGTTADATRSVLSAGATVASGAKLRILRRGDKTSAQPSTSVRRRDRDRERHRRACDCRAVRHWTPGCGGVCHFASGVHHTSQGDT